MLDINILKVSAQEFEFSKKRQQELEKAGRSLLTWQLRLRQL